MPPGDWLRPSRRSASPWSPSATAACGARFGWHAEPPSATGDAHVPAGPAVRVAIASSTQSTKATFDIGPPTLQATTTSAAPAGLIAASIHRTPAVGAVAAVSLVVVTSARGASNPAPGISTEAIARLVVV